MSDPPTVPNEITPEIKVVLARLDGLKEDIGELKSDMNSHNKREIDFERLYEREHQIVVARTEKNESRIGVLEAQMADVSKDVKALTSSIAPLLFAHKVLIFIGSAFGLSVIALIWAIITHSVQLVVP